jgi:hypothetical protein
MIRKFDTKDVGHIDNGLILWIISFGSGDVGLDAIDLLIRPLEGVGSWKLH